MQSAFSAGTPEEALEFPKRFLTYAMTYASDEEIESLRKYFSDDDFKEGQSIPGKHQIWIRLGIYTKPDVERENAALYQHIETLMTL